jgi:hypothetical protein
MNTNMTYVSSFNTKCIRHKLQCDHFQQILLYILFKWNIMPLLQVENLCVVTPCDNVIGHQHFGGSCCLHLQGKVMWGLRSYVYIQVAVFWVVTPCSVVVGYRRFGRPNRLNLHPELDTNLHRHEYLESRITGSQPQLISQSVKSANQTLSASVIQSVKSMTWT